MNDNVDDVVHDDQSGEPSAPVETNGNGVAPSSVIAQLRRRRAALQQERHIDLEVPGYDGMLLARYHPVAWERLQEINQRVEKTMRSNPRRELIAAVDVLINACECMLYREARGGNTAKVLGGDNPMRYDKRLAETMGVEGVATARDVLFGLYPDDLSITSTYVELMEWQGEGETEVDDELVGEANSAT